MSEGQRPHCKLLYSFIIIPWAFIEDSSNFFLLINAGVLVHVKKMKPDLDMHFSNFQGLGSVGRIALEGGTEIESETASRTIQKRHEFVVAITGRSSCEATRHYAAPKHELEVS